MKIPVHHRNFHSNLAYEMRTRAGASPPTSSTNRPSGRFERRRLGAGGPEGARRAAPSNLVGSAIKSMGYRFRGCGQVGLSNPYSTVGARVRASTLEWVWKESDPDHSGGIAAARIKGRYSLVSDRDAIPIFCRGCSGPLWARGLFVSEPIYLPTKKEAIAAIKKATATISHQRCGHNLFA